MNSAKQEHNRSIAIIKGICIILMVIGHSGGSSLMGDLLSLFRMPCFFFASGYLFKDKYLDSPKQFLYRRFKGLWWKFIEWSLIFLLLHHIFFKLHIYQQDYEFEDYKRMLFHILTMTRTEQLLGGYWFLKDLLYGSIFGLGFLKIEACILKHYYVKSRSLLNISILFIILVLALCNTYFPFHIPTIGTHAFLSCAFYLTGVFAHRYSIMDRLLTWKYALSCMAILAIISCFYHGSMSSVGIEAVIYYLSALFGIVMVSYVANKVTVVKNRYCELIVKIFNYVGTKTFHILTFHFLGFKIVTATIILISSKYCVDNLASFPVLSTDIPGLWIIYTAVSIAFSLLVSSLLDRVKVAIFSK